MVHTVDIIAEAGFGKILHKWVEFDVREDMAFLNGTLVIIMIFSQPSTLSILKHIKLGLYSKA